jgi:hypothetical protein
LAHHFKTSWSFPKLASNGLDVHLAAPSSLSCRVQFKQLLNVCIEYAFPLSAAMERRCSIGDNHAQNSQLNTRCDRNIQHVPPRTQPMLGMAALRHERSFHNHALRRQLEPALRDFYEAPGAPRQIPFGSDSRVQIVATTETEIR